MKKNFKKGFTLIELLVVVAIIGILASVILASVNSAKRKSEDSAVKNSLISARTQADVFYNTNTASNMSYTNVCTNGLVGGVQGIGLQVLGAAKATGLTSYESTLATAGSLTTATCHSDSNSWAAEAPLKNTAGSVYCVDSLSAGVVTTTPLESNDTSCN